MLGIGEGHLFHRGSTVQFVRGEYFTKSGSLFRVSCSWHDHYQWCQKAVIESDLRPLESVWQRCAATALEKAEIQLVGGAKLLPKSSGKKKHAGRGDAPFFRGVDGGRHVYLR